MITRFEFETRLRVRPYDEIVAGTGDAKLAWFPESLPGAERFCTIHTCLVPLVKQGQNLLDALVCSNFAA